MNNEINIEEIMEEIRQSIKERGYGEDPLSFEDVEISKSIIPADTGYDAEQFMQELGYLNRNWQNSFHPPVAGGNPIAVFIRRVIRKCTRFMIFHVVNFQNAYNASNVRCMNQVKEYMAEMESYKQRIEQLEKEIKYIVNDLEEGIK